MDINIEEKDLYDVIVVGGGPAGLTAALYLARACYRVLVVEKEKFGGQITITSEVVNYPGQEAISGTELTDRMRRQAEKFGAEFLLADVRGIEARGPVKTVKTDKGDLASFGIVVATGAHPRMIGFPGEAEFRGHGVAYCATCDGEFFTGKEVFVIGGGFAAAEESVFLTRYASHVTIVIREEDFTCARATADLARSNPNIRVLTETEVESAEGDSMLKRITLVHRPSGERTVYEAPEGDTFGIFVFAGYVPSTDLVKGIVDLDPAGYILTDRGQKTSVDGIYAAGDVCVKNLRQVVTATGDGAQAATELEKYVSAMQEETGLHPRQPVTRVRAEGVRAGSGAGEKAGRAGSEGSGLFTEDMIAQLNTVFARMEEALILEVYRDERPASDELTAYMEELAGLTDKLSVRQKESEEESGLPFVRVLRADGSQAGMAFHGVPGGHEFTSFVLGLYNASGPGQKIDGKLRRRAEEIGQKTDIKIMVSLTCTMCPDLVTAAQRIASLNPLVSAEVYDLNHFPEFRDRYQVMSVPCFVINDGQAQFGRKNIEELLDILEA